MNETNAHTMNQHTTTRETQQSAEGEIIDRYSAGWMLRREFGIPDQAMSWLLFQAAYRPQVARYVDVDLGEAFGTTIRQADGWNRADVLAAARVFMTECTKATPSLWTHPKIAGRFRLRPPADPAITGAPATTSIERPRAGRKVPSINLRRISPDDLADAKGFADDWAEGVLTDESLSEDALAKLGFLRYGLPSYAVHLALTFEPYKPEAVAWVKLPRPRGPMIPTRWRPQEAHAAVLAFIAECRPAKGGHWTHPHMKDRFKLRHPDTLPPLLGLEAESMRTDEAYLDRGAKGAGIAG